MTLRFDGSDKCPLISGRGHVNDNRIQKAIPWLDAFV